MVGLMGCVVQGREDVFALKKGIIGEYLLERGSGRQQFEHIGDTDAVPANARTTAALAGFDRDSIETF